MTELLFRPAEYLPKCIVARIDKYWYPTLPVDYPESSSIFSFTTGDDKVAMLAMEANLGTEESIIDPETLPENSAVGAYLGTYDVEAEPGETTLLSPNRLPDNAIGAIAYHYNAEEDTWTQIEDIEITDGYVWGQLDEFSPIAVFALVISAYITDVSTEILGQTGNVLVCNGLPVKVHLDDEGKIIAETGAVQYELAEGDSIVGGSFDGTPVKSTNIYIGEGVKLNYVVGGSWVSSKEDAKNHTDSIKVVAKGATIGILTGAGIWNSADLVEISIEDTKIERGMGTQMCYVKGKSSNKTMEDSDKGLGANQWVKKAVVTAKDSDIAVLYPGGSNGYCTTMDAEMTVENCTCEYLCNGQSNGTIYNVKSTITDSTITYFNNNNRGHYYDGKVYFKGGNTVENLFVFCDNDPNKEMADVRGKIYVDINAGDKANLYVGSVANHEVTTAEEADLYLDAVKISRSADITYERNADAVLKDVLRIK